MALADSLVAYWSLEESSGTRADATGRGNDMSPTGSPGNVAGKLGSALSLDGSTQYVNRASTSDLVMGDIDFTIAAWVYTTITTGSGGVVGKFTSGDREWLIDREGADHYFFCQKPDNSGFTFATKPVPGTSQWYFIVAWHDSVGNSVNIKINDGATGTASHTVGCRTGTGSAGIGTYGDGSIKWTGRIDDIGIWKRALTSGEMTSLYNGGAGLAYADIAGGQPTTLRHGATGRRLFGPRIGAGGW